MTSVKFSRRQFELLFGSKITKEIQEKIPLFGTPLENLTEEEIEIEIFPNRPDLISLQGYVRSFKQFISRGGIENYRAAKPKENYKVKISPSVKQVRPFTACAIVTNLEFNDEKIKQIIDMQEKLHMTVGRNRKKVAIGIYPLEKIKLPISYEARDPEKIRFVPLDYDKEMTGKQILMKHPTGKEFSHLLEDADKLPVFTDANSKILSMPPIINSQETGKVTSDTKSVFVECSGGHFPTLSKTLNIIVTTLADMCGKIFQMELEYPEGVRITPDLKSEKIKISPKNVNKLLGLSLKEKDIQKLLAKMGILYSNNSVLIPPYRTDILHEVDLIEDIAIAYGYENFKAEIPNISTVGKESGAEKFKMKLREILIGLGIIEVCSYHLIKEEEAKIFSLREKIELENSKTEYKILRPNLLIPVLRTFSENKDNDYPQEIFEIGSVFSFDKNGETETGINEREKLIVALSPANFTRIKQVLDYLANSLGIEVKLEESRISGLIDGRSAKIICNSSDMGYLGEVHPETLRDWGIKMPLAVFEISLKELIK